MATPEDAGADRSQACEAREAKGGGPTRASPSGEAARAKRELKGGPNRGAIGGKRPQKIRQDFLSIMATPRGLEPLTSCLEGTCSIQLSYGVTSYGLRCV